MVGVIPMLDKNNIEKTSGTHRERIELVALVLAGSRDRCSHCERGQCNEGNIIFSLNEDISIDCC